MPSIAFVAGDPSGDAHAARLITALRTREPALRVTGLGGPAMRHAGAELLADLTTTAAIGPFDAARHVGTFLRAKRLLDEHLRRQRPSLVVLVDFGDYNLPVIAPLVKRHGLPIAYYVSPQVWAWGRWRLRYVRRCVDRMIVLFPFEAAFYERAGVPVTWVGHPLVGQPRPAHSKDEALRRYGLNPWRMTAGLLPGSRAAEVRRHLPLMLAAARRVARDMPGIQFLLLKAPGVEERAWPSDDETSGLELRVADGETPQALQVMDAAVVGSGTATLEAALAGTPMVVVYRTSLPTYLIARSVVRVPHIAMVNLLAERPVVPELVQYAATPARIAASLVELLRDEERSAAMRAGLQEVAQRLGPPGAVDRAADVVLEMLKAQSAVVS